MHNTPAMDFFDLKRDVENLLPSHLDTASIDYQRADLAFLHPGQSANLFVDGEHIGYFGQLHPAICDDLDLPVIWVAQFELNKLIKLHQSTKAIALPSKFPSVHRDLAFLVDISLSWQDVAQMVWQSVGEYLTDLVLFDVYQGDKLPQGKKSFAFTMTLQNPNATLDDDAIKQAMDKVIVALTDTFNAQLRDS